MDAGFCVDCLEEAIGAYGVPEVFNTDQGPQFTSGSFTGVLLDNGVAISMGRYLLLQYLHSLHPCRLRARTGIGQYFCRTAVADREI
jgi:transposase InsO family protein